MRPLWQYYNPKKHYSLDVAPASPAFEVSLTNECLINPIPRFLPIFAPLFEYDLDVEERRQLENVFLHFLALLDLHCGLDRRELLLKHLDEELRAGLWGATIQNIYAGLNDAEQRDIKNALYEQEFKNAPSFGHLLRKWFPGTLFYEVVETNELIIVLPSQGDVSDSQKLDLLLKLFAPLRQCIRITWQKAPCLLDEMEGVLDACIIG